MTQPTLYSLLLTLLLFTAMSWGQDSSSPDEKAEPETAATEEATNNEPDAEKTPKPLQRLPSHALRSKSPSNQNSSMAIVAKSFSAQEAHWITTEGERFFVLWQADRSGSGKGALLILHAEGEHPAWPITTLPLHDTLPDYGWATMAISLPNPQKRSIPPRTFPAKTLSSPKATIENNVAVEDETTNKMMPSPPKTSSNSPKGAISIESITEQRLTAALAFLHDKGQFNIAILGSGVGAIRAHTFINAITPQVTDEKLSENLKKPIRAIILYNARNQLPTMTEDYKYWFIDPEIPFMDIFTTTDSRNHKAAKQRQILARQKNALTYRQVKLAEIPHERLSGENRLSKRIRSFLEAYVRGVQVGKETSSK